MSKAREAALSVLASRSLEDAELEIERVITDSARVAREAAALELEALHARLIGETAVRGRTLGVLMEAARYVRSGTLVWLDKDASVRRGKEKPRPRVFRWECRLCHSGGRTASTANRYASVHSHFRESHRMRMEEAEGLFELWVDHRVVVV